ncbi:MAG: glycosyltransferase family 4 protein [Bacteriovoracaceae bacterium]|nr:glycosyltransferase family 4 protein [Bacteriovoracaceae bacterium]
MRICLVSPHFKPRPGGVSDHSYELAQHFHDLGHEVFVLTSSDVPEGLFDFTVFKQPDWGWSHVFNIRDLIGELKADLVLFQWTPLAFSKDFYGLAFFVPFLLFHLRSLNTKVIVHESHYPLSPSLKGLFIGVPHFFQFCLIALWSRKLYFSHEGNELKWAGYLPFLKRKFSTLPVYSNIKNHLKSDEGLNADIPLKKHKLIYFGGAHPTNSFDHLLIALNKAQEELGKENVSLYLLGLSRKVIPDLLLSRLDQDVFALGFLSEEGVSSWLKRADLVLCPFLDGVTTRRGTIMAALLHGKAIVTTTSYFTVESIPWHNFLYATAFEDLNAYADCVVHALTHPKEAIELGQRGLHFYTDSFSVEAASKTLLK